MILCCVALGDCPAAGSSQLDWVHFFLNEKSQDFKIYSTATTMSYSSIKISESV